MTVHAGRKNVKYASDKIVLIPTDEFAVLEDKFIKKSILIHGNLPLKVDDLKDIPSDQGDGVFAWSYLSNGDFLSGENCLIEDRPFAYGVFVEFLAIGIELILIGIIVYYIASFYGYSGGSLLCW